MSLRGWSAPLLLAAAVAFGGGQVPLDPVALSGLQVWADTFDGSTLMESGGGVAKSGSEVASWISRRGPSFGGTGARRLDNAIAKQAAIRFAGTNLVSKSNYALSATYTLLASFRMLTVGRDQTLIQLGSAAGVTLRLSADDHLQVWTGGALALSSRQRWNAKDHAVVAVSSDGLTTRLWIDGTLDTETPSEGVLMPMGSGRLAVGGQVDGREPANAYLTGLALYKRALSADERRAAEDRLLRNLAISRETSYVSTVKGQAGAGGLLPNDPVATLDEAIERRTANGGGTICVEAPPELPIRGMVKVEAPVPLTIRGVGSRTWSMVCANRYTTGWQKVQTTGTFRRAWSIKALRSAWVETMPDSNGQPLALQPAVSLATIAQGQYFLEDGFVHIRLPGDANPNRHTIEIPKETSCLRVANPLGSLTIENGIFRGGTQGAVEIGQPTVGGHLVAKDCTAELGFCGFKIGGQLSDGVFVRCIARRNTNDGFNLHGYEGVRSSMQISNCEAYLNGDEGASPHDDTKMTISTSRLHHNGDSGFMAIGHSRILLSDVEIDHNGQNGFNPIENGFVAWKFVTGRLLRCKIHDNNGPGIYREAPGNIKLESTTSFANATADR